MYGGQDSGYEDDTAGELHALCKTGSLGNILSWLQSYEPRDIQWYYEGETALHACVLSHRNDAADVACALVDLGCDVNAPTIQDGNTALHLCVQFGVFPRDFDVIVALRNKECDLGIRNKALRTAYDVAVANGDFELAGTLDGTVPVDMAKEHYTRAMGRKYGPHIVQAVLKSDSVKLYKSIQLGGDPNHKNKYGNGAIHYAITHCDLPVHDTLSTLLHANADSNLTNEEGDTALNLCIKSESLRDSGQMARCVQLLVDAGADSDIQDLDGRDAVRLAEDKNYEDILQILRTKDVPPTPPREPTPPVTPRPDVNAPNAEGLCPIHVATLEIIETQRHKRIEELLEEGAIINKTVVDTGNTSLHLCAERNYGPTAKLLLDNHINYHIKNKEGKTAYEVAESLQHQPVMDAIDEKRGIVRENWQKGKNKARWCTIL